MSPIPGSIHRRPRSDSGAVRLWTWARTRRRPWTCPEVAEAAAITDRRTREIVRALHEARLLDCVRESEVVGQHGQEAAEWELSAAGRAMLAPPVLIVDGEAGRIVGIRAAVNGDGTAKLRRAVERSGLSTRAAARAMGVHDS